MAKNYNPYDLADYVFKQLDTSKIKGPKPSQKVLEELFNTLYYTSLQTEEGEFIKVTITLIDPDQIPVFDEHRDAFDKWQFYPFDDRLEFSVKNLVKLSKAADPWSASLAVYYDDKSALHIYGMIDQSIHYQSFLNYEREVRPDHPGIMQTMINGIGILNVMLDFQALATLNQNALIKLYPNVFGFGPVSEYLKENTLLKHERMEQAVGERLTKEQYDIFQEILLEYIIQALSRILLKIKSYHHGGAILITKDWEIGLEKKYKIKYNRILASIKHILHGIADSEFFEDEIKKATIKKKAIPPDLHEDYNDTELDLEEAYDEMIGAVRFVSSLSCVDGLVLLSPFLTVRGFGTVIAEKGGPEKVYINKTSKISAAPQEMYADHFGTRHRSMFAYCLKHPDSVGFVVSQDGEIRAIKCIDGKVFVWENIKVYQFQRSTKLPRTIISAKK